MSACQDPLTDDLRVFGPDHPPTLLSRHDLARWRGEAGDPAGAVMTCRSQFPRELGEWAVWVVAEVDAGLRVAVFRVGSGCWGDRCPASAHSGQGAWVISTASVG